MSIETQLSIAYWRLKTFGPASCNYRLLLRAQEEMAELEEKLADNDNHPDAAEEVADVMICLYALAAELGEDVHELIDAKMERNRERRWVKDGNGCGRHVKE